MRQLCQLTFKVKLVLIFKHLAKKTKDKSLNNQQITDYEIAYDRMLAAINCHLNETG